jgi:putative ABC transport system permease protein
MRALLRRLRYALDWLLRRRSREAEMDRELRFHLEMEAAANRRSGLGEEEAARLARASFGGVEPIKEACREATGVRLIETFFQDLRHGLRLVRRSPAFSAAAILTLALGIGGTTAILSVAEAVLVRPLPLPDPERVMLIWETDRVQGTDREGASLPDYLDVRERCKSFAELAAYRRSDLTLQAEGDPERLSAARVTASFFKVLGLEPAIGRGLLAAEEQPGRDRVALLSDGLWRRRFGGDPGAVGKTLTLDGEPYTVVGVMPPQASLPADSAELWVPLAPPPDRYGRGQHVFRVYARLRPGVGRVEAQAEIDAVMGGLEAEYYEDNRGRGARVVPLGADLVRQVRPALEVLVGAVFALLLVACVNVAGLLLARGAVRGPDLAIRAALGGGRLRLVRQLMTESLVLAAMGTGLGVLLGAWGSQLLKGAAPASIPRLSEVGLDGPVLAAVVAAALLTWFLFGLLPSLRTSRAGLAAALPAGREGGSRRDRQSLRSALVVVQVALSLVLLVVAGLLMRSFRQLRAVDPGFEPANLLAAAVKLPESKYPFSQSWPVLDWPQAQQFADELRTRLRALPGVRSAALALYSPVEGGWTTRITVEGRPVPPLAEQEESHYRPVGAGYFETVGIPLLAGRTFTADDRGGAPLVAAVNRAFARRYFPTESPVGGRLNVYNASREIVGVVADERFMGLAADPEPTVYLPSAQNPQPGMTLLVRAERSAARLVPEVRAVVRSLDSDLAVYDVTLVDEALSASLADRRFTVVLLAVFAATALGLAGLGLYGLLAYLVARRAHEIGVRMALGAARRQVVRLVLGRALVLVLAGIGVGGVAALGAVRLTAGLLFRVGGADPATFSAVALVLLAAAALAAWLPARRASGIDPQAALRSE